MKRILVTGVNGLIGSTIAEYLMKEYEVIGTSIEATNQTSLDISYYQTDITNKASLETLPTSIDVLIHCAAIITGDNFSNALLNANCIGVQNVASYAIKTRCSQVIYFSSLPIIGKPEIIPIKENHPINPPTVYHITKYFGELVLRKLLPEESLVIFRIPSPIGRKTAPNKIVPVFVKNAINNVDFTLLGNGRRIQNYIDVRDIARAIRCAIDKNAFGTYNIASEKSYTNKELAELCISLFNSKSRINYKGIDREENYQWIVSTEKAKNELGFVAKYTLADTILEIGKNFQS